MEKESSRVCRGKNIGKKKNGMVIIEACSASADILSMSNDLQEYEGLTP